MPAWDGGSELYIPDETLCWHVIDDEWIGPYRSYAMNEYKRRSKTHFLVFSPVAALNSYNLP